MFDAAAPRPGPGVWLAHKPVGATSFEVVNAFQAHLAASPGKALKVCHGGALDPFAQGLLPVLVGGSTRLFPWLHDAPKRYLATVHWGTETDSGDAGGQVVASGSVSGLTHQRITSALTAFHGWTKQVPPATSNKWVDGERAYVRAHRGETVVLEPTEVYLHEARVVSHQGAETVLDLLVRGGFYVRSLARDVGRTLGVPAHLIALRRTAIGPWRDVEGAPVQLAAREVVPWLPAREVTDAEWGRLRGGASVPRGAVQVDWPLPAGFPAPKPEMRAFHQGRLVGLLRPDALNHLVLGVTLGRSPVR